MNIKMKSGVHTDALSLIKTIIINGNSDGVVTAYIHENKKEVGFNYHLKAQLFGYRYKETPFYLLNEGVLLRCERKGISVSKNTLENTLQDAFTSGELSGLLFEGRVTNTTAKIKGIKRRSVGIKGLYQIEFNRDIAKSWLFKNRIILENPKEHYWFRDDQFHLKKANGGILILSFPSQRSNFILLKKLVALLDECGTYNPETRFLEVTVSRADLQGIGIHSLKNTKSNLFNHQLTDEQKGYIKMSSFQPEIKGYIFGIKISQ